MPYSRAELAAHFETVNHRRPMAAELDALEAAAASRERDSYAQELASAPLGVRISQAARQTAQPGTPAPMGFSDIPGHAAYETEPLPAPSGLATAPLEVLNPLDMTATPQVAPTRMLTNPQIGAQRGRADALIGTPYQWGGTTKQGIDCSAFISNVWGVSRQTTDTLGKVAKPVSRDALEPGDALNLPTYKDPRGYGHVRMFDGWADPDKKTMYVYESSSATGGVVRRTIPYDAAYQPMRLATSDTAPDRADPIAAQTQAAGITTPSRPAAAAPADPDGLRAYARGAATKAGIDPEQFVRQIQQESGFNPRARNPSGATGIAQIVPSAHPTVDPTDPRASLDYAATWMSQLGKQYGGDQRKALAHYNGGGGAVAKMEAGTPYGETVKYLDAVTRPTTVTTGGADPGLTRERAQFLEANSPGESTSIAPKDGAGLGVGSGSTGSTSTTRPDDPAETALKAWLGQMKLLDSYSNHIADQVNAVDTRPTPFKLPGIPAVQMPWGPYRLPGSR